MVLFLGAGSAIGSNNSFQDSPPLGTKLAELLATKCGWDYDGEALSTVYTAATKVLGSVELNSFLAAYYRHVQPSRALNTLARMPWARIYTTNIDDAMEQALSNHSNQTVNIRSRADMIEDKAQLLQTLDYVYLNGSIRRPKDGYIFSPEEYGKASADHPLWYEEVAVDFMQCVFIFIGTKLNEPAFFHHVERFKKRAGTSSPQSYLLIPKASAIEVAGFETIGLKHLNVTLDDFATWLEGEFQPFPSPTEIAQNKFPELRAMLGEKDLTKRAQFADLFAEVTLVSRQTLARVPETRNSGSINPFYKGYKANWRDILDAVPAKLTQYAEHLKTIIEGVAAGRRLFPVIGAAGSGKSTFVYWLALSLGDANEKVYYLERDAKEIVAIAREVSRSNPGRLTFIVVDRLDPFKADIRPLLDKYPDVVVIGAESQNVWRNRIAAEVSTPTMHLVAMKEISAEDVTPILEKLRLFGPWTRLAGLSDKNRRIELFDRSKRQLLIGLMEATTGLGFEEIISRDFNAISSYGDKAFFVVACIATMHRAELSQSAAARTIWNLGSSEPPAALAARLDGLVVTKRDRISVRHPIYARKIIESVVDRAIVYKAATALLESFSVYPHPVSTSLDRNDQTIFKSVFNHRFLKSILRDDMQEVVSFYQQFEKIYETDGLFWLQYGLAMRSFDRQEEALAIIQTAYNAYPHDHTTHALGQQMLILAASDDVAVTDARKHLIDAIKLLDGLDGVLRSEDTYPIVTLAEGHVNALRRLDGIPAARIKAGEYIQLLDRRLRGGYESRLDEARIKLFAFSATGAWRDDPEPVRA